MKNHVKILLGFMIAGALMAGMSEDFSLAATGKAGSSPAVVSVDMDDAVSRIMSIGQKENSVMDHLYHLTKNIGPRMAGSDNHREATQWARDRFEDLGLTDAHLEKAALLPVGFNRGVSTGSIVAPVEKDLHFYTPAWSAGTPGAKRAPAVAAPDSPDELRSMRARFEDSWVLRPGFTDLESYEAYMRAWDALEVDIAGEILPSGGKLIHSFGNPDLEWEDLPKTPKVILLETEWEDIAGMLDEGREVYLEFDIQNHFVKGPVPVYNVVADIPGREIPDEYVIVGAHIDSWDMGEGALDNGTGVAAAIEAARIIMESGARPRRTVRFILFAGEEVGMLGSKAYTADHPDLLPRISAVLNMDKGSDYIRGIDATNEMEEDFESVFFPVRSLDPDKPFEIKVAEHLPEVVDCGGEIDPETKKLTSGCGGGMVKIIRCGEDGTTTSVTAEELNDHPAFTETSACASLIAEEPSGEDPPTGRGAKKVIKSLGSSDHAAFLSVGVPAFMWNQSGEVPYGKHIHTENDKLDKVVPEYKEHSSTVIALAAYGIANLDHLLSRENLLAELEEGLE